MVMCISELLGFICFGLKEMTQIYLLVHRCEHPIGRLNCCIVNIHLFEINTLRCVPRYLKTGPNFNEAVHTGIYTCFMYIYIHVGMSETVGVLQWNFEKRFCQGAVKDNMFFLNGSRDFTSPREEI